MPVVGLKVGPRPKLSFPGVWLYAGDVPIVHIIFGKPIPALTTAGPGIAGLVVRRTPTRPRYRPTTGPIPRGTTTPRR